MATFNPYNAVEPYAPMWDGPDPGDNLPLVLPDHCVIWRCREPRVTARECAAHAGEIRAPVINTERGIRDRAAYREKAKDPEFLAMMAARKREARRRKREAGRAA